MSPEKVCICQAVSCRKLQLLTHVSTVLCMSKACCVAHDELLQQLPSVMGNVSSRCCLPLQVNAEIVVTFEGTTEFGNPFMARQSYLMDEIMWGHQFNQIIYHPEPEDTRYRIDFSRYRRLAASACSKDCQP